MSEFVSFRVVAFDARLKNIREIRENCKWNFWWEWVFKNTRILPLITHATKYIREARCGQIAGGIAMPIQHGTFQAGLIFARGAVQGFPWTWSHSISNSFSLSLRVWTLSNIKNGCFFLGVVNGGAFFILTAFLWSQHSTVGVFYILVYYANNMQLYDSNDNMKKYAGVGKSFSKKENKNTQQKGI